MLTKHCFFCSIIGLFSWGTSCQSPVSPTLDPISIATTAIPDKLSTENNLSKTAISQANIPATVVPTKTTTKPVTGKAQPYAWLDHYDPQTAIQAQVPVPKGYIRVAAKENSFATWLRGLPLETKGTKVLLHNGQIKPYQDGAYRVLNIDIGTRDLQQCADAIMRLKAEYHYSMNDFDNIHFNYTSGDNIRFTDWSKGKQPQVKGSKVSFSSPSGTTDTSYKNFKKYLISVYNYAGTASLSKELKSKKVEDIASGDVFIWGGFPGHAILVMDVAQHETTGKKIFLVAQSYMPAQSIHLLHNFNDANLSPWYSEDFGAVLETPEWDFERSALKQFVESK